MRRKMMMMRMMGMMMMMKKQKAYNMGYSNYQNQPTNQPNSRRMF